mmetsp:Transcript_152621/g.370434  ORF Transcript_152621/g.370434 Transcript_152621/m.370434 type:complete len:208 (-) Transcript_152621:122-745(-)
MAECTGGGGSCHFHAGCSSHARELLPLGSRRCAHGETSQREGECRAVHLCHQHPHGSAHLAGERACAWCTRSDLALLTQQQCGPCSCQRGSEWHSHFSVDAPSGLYCKEFCLQRVRLRHRRSFGLPSGLPASCAVLLGRGTHSPGGSALCASGSALKHPREEQEAVMTRRRQPLPLVVQGGADAAPCGGGSGIPGTGVGRAGSSRSD